MTSPATPFAAALAILGSIAMLAYTSAASAADGFRPRMAEIGAVEVVETLELDVSKPCAIPDDQLANAQARVAKDAVETRERRALVALERTRVLDRDSDVVSLAAADERFDAARARERSDQEAVADAERTATARCATRARFRESAVGETTPQTEAVIRLPQQHSAQPLARSQQDSSWPSRLLSIPSTEIQPSTIDIEVWRSGAILPADTRQSRRRRGDGDPNE